MYFGYILQSHSTGRFYVGQCEDLIRRFHEHQAGLNKATRNRGPWWIPYFDVFETRAEAMAWERSIKNKKSAESIRRIILQAMPRLDLN